MTKQEILSAIKACARELGRAPKRRELIRMTGVTCRELCQYFGGYHRALRQCRLKSSGKVAFSEVLRDWATVTRKLRRVPSLSEYLRLGRYSAGPFKRRARGWHDIGRAFTEHAKENGWTKEWRDVLEMIAVKAASAKPAAQLSQPYKPKQLYDRPVYGRAMHACQLAHAPVNEQGVLFLFGVMAERLGFVVMHVQHAFPDCEAMRCFNKDHCQRVWIEVEYESRNFLKHRHSIKGCDLIVCWKHNWPECPLEVIELSRYLPEMPGLPKATVVAKKRAIRK